MLEDKKKPPQKRPGRRGRNRGRERDGDDEFEQKIIDLARVTRVMKGGKRMRFRAGMVLGDKKGNIALAVAKGADVTIAITKAVTKAKKKLINVPIVNETIPHEVRMKYKAAKVLIKPAPLGTGIKAGGVMRSVLELAGIGNVVGKIMGSKNNINIAKATIEALKSFQSDKVFEQKEKKNNGKVVKTEVAEKQDKEDVKKPKDTKNNSSGKVVAKNNKEK